MKEGGAVFLETVCDFKLDEKQIYVVSKHCNGVFVSVLCKLMQQGAETHQHK